MVYATIDQHDFSTGELIQQPQNRYAGLDTAALDRTLARLELAFYPELHPAALALLVGKFCLLIISAPMHPAVKLNCCCVNRG
ncbi:MAG: hypothetical protein R3E95_05915 [Thiolinea sp.]